MLALHPRLVTSGDADEGRAPCYCVMVTCVSLLLFVALAAAVGIARAVAAAAAVVVLLGLVGCLARTSGTTGRAVAVRRLVHQRCACGMSDAAIRALPTFAYQPDPPPAAIDKGAAGGEASPVLCAVCLEDVRAGEMVRQLLPACSHLFHVDCVDAWLRAHRTCPLCRRELPTRNNVAAAKPSHDLLPPV